VVVVATYAHTPFMLRVIHELIPLSEWLGHMSLFHGGIHANVQIRNDSARTLHINMIMVVLNEEEDALSAYRGVALVPPHTLEPGYSHLYSIPQQQQHWRGGAAARVTLAFRDDAGDAAVCLLLRSGDRLRVASSSL
jgi:hypothetical protein